MLWNGEDFTGWEFVFTNANVQADTVWTVQDGVIRCNGIPNGYMRTVSEYENYVLHVDWRWVEREGNSGVLLHAQPPDNVWPVCIECQLKSGSAGDFVLMRSGLITVNGTEYNNPDGFEMIRKKADGVENPIGEWNNYQIICKDDEITCFVNGVLQNKGTGSALTKGKICFQSEGAPIEFRDIRLELIK
ncbi:MAG: DUF1080 domain-containing protein [bacterium]|nr:DUF1080 domain-containing protein [bacterium]